MKPNITPKGKLIESSFGRGEWPTGDPFEDEHSAEPIDHLETADGVSHRHVQSGGLEATENRRGEAA